MSATTRDGQCTAAAAATTTLKMALELSDREWRVAFATCAGDRPRCRTVPAAQALTRLPQELARAKARFGLPASAPVVSCYEIGYDGFWVHRALVTMGVDNYVIEAASIEVNRRARRAKSDGLDVGRLLRLLLRYTAGERKAFAVVRVPTVAQEDGRQLHRALGTWQRERTRVRNRIRGLLATQGVRCAVGRDFGPQLAILPRWDGQPLPPALRDRLEREWTLLQLVEAQMSALTAARQHQLAVPTPDAAAGDEAAAQVHQLMTLRGIGETSAWVFVREGLGWRHFRNRREVAAFVGVVPTPYQSGTTARELGISKAGNARLRAMLHEISWAWLRYQPRSALSQWYATRFADAGGRARRIGIVAVARKLVIALWRYLTTGVLPDGAELKPQAA
jgi:transposase